MKATFFLKKSDPAVVLLSRRARFDRILPKGVEVAIGIDGGRLVGNVERSRSFGSRLEVLDLAAMLGLEVDELDVVLLGHRVWRLPDADSQRAILAAFDGWYMVLGLAVGNAGLESFHWASATMRSYFGSTHLEHDVAADRATEEDSLHS